MSTSILKKILCAVFPLVGALNAMGTGCTSTTPTGEQDEHVGATDQALTPAQCNYFAVDGKVQICHRTASTTKPFTVLKISEAACINAHARHAGDYVAVNDPNCQGGGCLPEGAPCDATLPCCDGFSCTNGTCTPNVSDHCSPSPCQNGGSCVSDSSGYTCSCPAGYTGTNCENETNECVPNPCVDGTCLDGINSYVCECTPGFTGTNCEIDIDECASSPCVHGDCDDLINGYACRCGPGFTGTNCDVNIDECAANPCAHGQCTDGVNSYSCACDEGWSGTNCDTADGPTCSASQFVQDCSYSNAFGCPCGLGGPDCDIDLDECQSAPCLDGQCEDRLGGYLCICMPGIGGDLCNCSLPVADPCDPTPCLWGGECVDNGDSTYTCICPVGFSGTNCEIAG